MCLSVCLSVCLSTCLPVCLQREIESVCACLRAFWGVAFSVESVMKRKQKRKQVILLQEYDPHFWKRQALSVHKYDLLHMLEHTATWCSIFGGKCHTYSCLVEEPGTLCASTWPATYVATHCNTLFYTLQDHPTLLAVGGWCCSVL